MPKDWSQLRTTGPHLTASMPRKSYTVTKATGAISVWESNYGVLTGTRAKIGTGTKKGISSGVPFRPMSNYERYICVLSWKEGVWIYETSTHRTTMSGYYSSSSSHIEGAFPSLGRIPWNTNNVQRARAECMTKLGDSKASWGANLAEAITGVNRLGSSSAELFSLLLMCKRGDWRGIQAKLGTKSIAGTYLALHFGWAPLISDIHGTYEVLQKSLNIPLTLKAFKSVSDQGGDRNKSSSYMKNVNNVYTIKNSCTIYATLDDAEMANATRLGLNNPASWAWEVVPWSFLVDWVMPVGTCLSAIAAAKGLSFVGGCDSQTVDGFASGDRKGESAYTEISPQSFEAEFKSMRRATLSGFPRPIPYFKSPLSTSHVITASALYSQLTQTVRRR